LSRLVVQVTGADGAPLFFIDRPAGNKASALQPSCAIIAPKGQPIGRVAYDAAALGSSYLQSGGRGKQEVYRRFAASGQPLCEIRVEPVMLQYRRTGHHDFGDGGDFGHHDVRPVPVGGRFAVFQDMQGVQMALIDMSDSSGVADRFILQIGISCPIRCGRSSSPLPSPSAI
jgi:hypothetical protein